MVGAAAVGDMALKPQGSSEAPATAALNPMAMAMQPVELAGLVIERLNANHSAPVLVEVSRGYPFIWPAAGPITSYMDSHHPTGIDIGLDNSVDVPIHAMASGLVTFAGGSEAENYGYYVIIDHGGGLTSLYAHLDSISVTVGQSLQQGDVLGLGGNTGKSDGKHLHLEIVDNGQRYDPLRLLPLQSQPDEKSSVDCGVSAIVLNQGARAHFDFTAALGLRGIEAVTFEPIQPRTSVSAVWAEVRDRLSVEVITQPALGGVEERFLLSLTLSGRTQPEDDLHCEVVIKPLSLAPSYYVRAVDPTPVPATATPDFDDLIVEPEETPTEEPTATVTAEATQTPTVTLTPTETATPTVTPELTVTPDVSVTPDATPQITETVPPAESTPPAAIEATATPTLTPTSTTTAGQ